MFSAFLWKELFSTKYRILFIFSIDSFYFKIIMQNCIGFIEEHWYTVVTLVFFLISKENT